MELNNTGATGPRGATGPMSPAFAKRMLALFLITVALFAYLAWRNEINANDTRMLAEQSRQYAIANCRLANKNTYAFNALLDQAIALTKKNKDITEEQRKVAIAFYESGKLNLADCVPPPGRK